MSRPVILHQIRRYIRAFFDPKVPWYAKLLIIFALVYTAFPFDVVTDVVPILGWLDDATVLGIMLYLFSRWLPPDR